MHLVATTSVHSHDPPPSLLCSIEKYRENYRNVLMSSFDTKLDPKVSAVHWTVLCCAVWWGRGADRHVFMHLACLPSDTAAHSSG